MLTAVTPSRTQAREDGIRALACQALLENASLLHSLLDNLLDSLLCMPNLLPSFVVNGRADGRDRTLAGARGRDQSAGPRS